MKKKIILLNLSLLSFFSGCNTTIILNSTSSNIKISDSNINSHSSSINFNHSNNDNTSINSSFTNQDIELTYENLFNPNNDIKFKLDFTNQSIHNLAKYSLDNNNNHCDMYHPADLTITLNNKQFVFEEVGVRMKGNTSKNSNFVNNEGFFNAYVHFKISFKETFDSVEDNDYYIREWTDSELRKNRKKRTLDGLEKLDLKYNKNQDATFTKQTYALHCFNDANLIAQKSNLIHTEINSQNDKLSGTYELLECIDDVFISRRFTNEESKGDLYKCTYTSMGMASLTKNALNNNLIGIENPANNYHPIYDLKTNKKTSNHATLINFINFINTENNDEYFRTNIENYINVDSYLRFEAIAYILGGPDDHRHNSNNYYLYFTSTTNKAYFIPYDYDRCFGILKDYEIDMSSVPYYTTKKAGQNRIWQDNPLMWRMFLSSTDNNSPSSKYPVIEEYKTIYNNYCIQYAEKYLNTSKFIAFTKQFKYAPSYNDDGGANNQTFSYYANNKLNVTLNN